jgi:hypothetical protein
MGHLSREISVALSLQKRADPVFFSLSRAVPVISHYGFRGEYCPSRERGWMPAVRWQHYLRERLRSFVAETGVNTLVFDGVVPYNGLLRARTDLPHVRFIWMRRGYWQHGVAKAPLHASSYFDLVLEPGDLAGAGDDGLTSGMDDAVRLPPVSLAEHVERLPRAAAAEALGLDPDRPTALITLSSGILNDVASAGAAALNAILENPDWQVAVTRSVLAASAIPLADRPRCVELSGVYPLAQYLSAFDAAVSAGGYNTVHELLYAGVPTLFVPNLSSGTDNQAARTRWLADHGLALYANEGKTGDIRYETMRLHDEPLRAELRKACEELDRPTGSAMAANVLAGLGNEPVRKVSWSMTRARVVSRSEATRVLGPKGSDVARRVLGRQPDPGPDRSMRVRVVDNPSAPIGDKAGATPLLFSDNLDATLINRPSPVEHIVADGSEAYWSRRRQIVDKFYNVVSP